MSSLRTDRLDLVPATLDLLEAELRSSQDLAHSLNARIPKDWPPGEYDRDAIEFFRAQLKANPEAVGWYGWYAIDRASSMLIGAAGYLGPPTDRGCVEIGYSIAAEFNSRGYATEIVRALVDRAFSTSRVHRVIAHTHRANEASSKILVRTGFSVVTRTTAAAPVDADLLEYERLRPGT